MPDDKIRAAARKRTAGTDEPHAAGSAAVAGHPASGGTSSSPAAGRALRMSGEIHDWLADLCGSDQRAAARVVSAVVMLMEEEGGLGDPLVVSTADSWPRALIEALDRSYQERLERLSALRVAAADAAKLGDDIQEQAAELASAQATMEELRGRLLEEGRPDEAAEVAGKLIALRQQALEVRGLLPGVIEASQRLAEQSQRLRTGADAMRARKEVLKASYVAAHTALIAREAIAAGPGGDEGGPEDGDGEETRHAAEARRAGLVAEMERELAVPPWPEGLQELRPWAPLDSHIRVLFADEPPGAVLLLAVMQGPEAGQYPEALMAAADLLRRVRAGQEPKATAHTYDSPQSFLAEFRPVQES